MNAEPGRLAAYADLVAAVLDLRSAAPTQAFDDAIAEAVASGALSDALARRLRLLQRQSERAMVEHAETVLPPALAALQSASAESGANERQSPAPPLQQAAKAAVEPPPALDLRDTEDVAEPPPAPVVQLQPRRLLVAGLRPLPDPAHRGTLP